MLYVEAKAIHSLKGKRIVPQIHHVGEWTAEDGEGFYILVMDRLGENLEQLFNKSDRKFTLETVLGIAERFLEIFEKVHEKGLLNRDIKPDNFVIGHNWNKRNTIYQIDFGLAMYYLQDGKHIPF